MNHCWPDIGKKKENLQGQDDTDYYDANIWQLEIMSNSFIYDEEGVYSYENLLINSKELPVEYHKNKPSGNLFPFLKALKDGDIDYFEQISKIIDGYSQ